MASNDAISQDGSLVTVRDVFVVERSGPGQVQLRNAAVEWTELELQRQHSDGSEHQHGAERFGSPLYRDDRGREAGTDEQCTAEVPGDVAGDIGPRQVGADDDDRSAQRAPSATMIGPDRRAQHHGEADHDREMDVRQQTEGPAEQPEIGGAEREQQEDSTDHGEADGRPPTKRSPGDPGCERQRKPREVGRGELQHVATEVRHERCRGRRAHLGDVAEARTPPAVVRRCRLHASRPAP